MKQIQKEKNKKQRARERERGGQMCHKASYKLCEKNAGGWSWGNIKIDGWMQSKTMTADKKGSEMVKNMPAYCIMYRAPLLS